MNSISAMLGQEGQPDRIKFLKGLLLPGLVAAVALTAAFVGAILIGDERGGDGVNRFVEALSGDSQTFLGDLDFIAPLGFAFAAGLVAAVNPCGFAMLPAYMGLYLGQGADDDEGNRFQARIMAKAVGKAVIVGLTVTAGFVVLFGVVGTIIGLGARSVVADILPYLGLSIGILLSLTGAWMLSGGKLYSGLAQRLATHMGDPGQVNVRGYFMFGLSYGTASLSCTLPIFLTVIGTTFAVSSIGTSFGQFLLYALGMGTVIMALTLGMALFKGAMVGALRKALPYVQPIGTWMMILAGTYIVFYWLTIGNILI